jgi:aspartate/methionine/tyrosine aminotransferase
MDRIQPPIIPVVGEFSRNTPGMISLGQGVAYYGPPPRAFDRVKAFLSDQENHKYGPVQGLPSLLELVMEKLHKENAMALESCRVVVTAGANMGFINALFAITDPGDEVILPLPYYFNQEMAIRMLNCTPVLVPTDENYQPEIEQIRAAITDRTRAIVTISPNNPSGAVYPKALLRAINCLCRMHGIYHISDEAYENFTYGSAQHFSPGSIEGAEAHTISLYSLSKAYGFASWRIGYMVIPEHLYLSVLKAQDTNLICAPLISQYAAIGALETGSTYCRERLQAIEQVRAVVLDELTSLGSHCTLPAAEGAFYVLVRIDTEMNPLALVERLIKEHRVAVIPGTAFGLEEECHLRISYGALDRSTATEGMQRFTRGLKAILNHQPL